MRPNQAPLQVGSIDEPFIQQKDRKILELGLSDGPHSPSLELNVEDPRRQPGATKIVICSNESPLKELDSIQASKGSQVSGADLRRYLYAFW